jgi:hypothetical protein
MSSLVWDQIDTLLRASVAESGRPVREAGSERDHRAVAPGVAVDSDEYEKRYGALDLEGLRNRMSPELFKAFVRHIGSIPGHPDLDVSEISAAFE